MKKVLLGLVLSLGIFSCTSSDELMPLSQKEDLHSFEFNAHTQIPTASPTGKGINTNYTLTVEVFVEGGHKIETKTFSSNISAHFNYKFETNYAGNVELKVTVSPAATVVKNISFIPTNEVTKEIGKYIEFDQLPATGSLTAVYNKETKQITTSTAGVEQHEVGKDFGDKLAIVKSEVAYDGQTESEYRTFTYDNSGKLISSFAYKSGPEGKTENAVLVYDGDRVIKIINNDKSVEEFTYENNNIIKSVNNNDQYYDLYRYNDTGKVREVISNGTNYQQSKSFDYSEAGKVIVTSKSNNQTSKIVYVLNENTNPMTKSVPAAFLKIIAIDDESNYNVVSKYNFEYEKEPANDPNSVTYSYQKDAKGRVVKQIATGKEEIEGKMVTSTRITAFQYMAR
jgi:hypothetical protein